MQSMADSVAMQLAYKTYWLGRMCHSVGLEVSDDVSRQIVIHAQFLLPCSRMHPHLYIIHTCSVNLSWQMKD